MAEKCDVAMVMGSESDLKVMTQATDILKEFGVPCEIRVISAHRTPHKANEYAASAKERGIRVSAPCA